MIFLFVFTEGYTQVAVSYHLLIMKLSLKVEYACRVLAQLARRKDNVQLAHIEELAELESIPANYLVQILNELRNGQLIISKRGKQGGYAIAREPALITIAEIVQVIEGELMAAELSEKGQSGAQVARVWRDIAQTLEAKANAYTVEDLIAAEKEMYYI